MCPKWETFLLSSHIHKTKSIKYINEFEEIKSTNEFLIEFLFLFSRTLFLLQRFGSFSSGSQSLSCTICVCRIATSRGFVLFVSFI